MNFIGIDMSLASAAIVIKSRTNDYVFLSYIKNYKKTKWTKSIEDFVDITGTSFRTDEDYSTQEVLKLDDYDRVTDIMINDIKKHIDISLPTYFAIEGYSYSSATSSIIDLVTISTLLRNKLRKFAEMCVYSPSSVKKSVCGLVYGWKNIAKKGAPKWETRSTVGVNTGLAGGDFKKRDMVQALNDSDCESKLAGYIRENFKEIYPMVNVPKPLDDITDAYWILRILLNDKILKKFKIIE